MVMGVGFVWGKEVVSVFVYGYVRVGIGVYMYVSMYVCLQ